MLGREYGKGIIRLSEISRQASVPADFLHTILFELGSAGLVETRRGSDGGYRLIRQPEQVTLTTVVTIIDAPMAGLACAAGGANLACAECAEANECQLGRVISEAHDALTAVFEKTTLCAGDQSGTRLTQTATSRMTQTI